MATTKPTTVMVFGTFDCLHPGHEYLFQEAKKHGDQIIVIVGRDNTVTKVKGNEPTFNERSRLKTIKKLEYIDKAVLGHKTNRHYVIEKYRPDVICLGYDQYTFTELLQKKLIELKLDCKIVRLSAYQPNKFKSSLIKLNYSQESIPQHLTNVQ